MRNLCNIRREKNNDLIGVHGNGNIILTTFSSLLAAEIVKMTTYSENNDVNLIKITFPFRGTL